MQHEILSEIPLLDKNGDLTEAGFAKKLLPVYRRADIKASPMRIKEWDYYLINNGRFALALTVDDNGYMGLDSISLLNFEEGWEITTSPMCFMPLGKRKLPETSAVGDTLGEGKNYSIYFKNDGSGVRTLIAQMKKFGPAGSLYAKVELFDEPEESMVIATPFDKPGHFYYNQKINCLRAKGEVTYDGRTYVFDPEDSFAVLDWGRGVWTYHNTWYWGSARLTASRSAGTSATASAIPRRRARICCFITARRINSVRSNSTSPATKRRFSSLGHSLPTTAALRWTSSPF